MSSTKNVFMTGIMIGLYFAWAIAYVVWAIVSFQWWLLIFAAVWAGMGFLATRTAKKNFETVQVELDLARSEGRLDAYTIMLGSGDNGHKYMQQVADEAEKA